jgi:DNA-binding CsgD family transcriptional regulator
MNLETLAFLHAPVGIALTESRVVLDCNSAFAEIFGGEPHAMRGIGLVRLYPCVDDYERIGAAGLKVMRETGRYHDERVMQRLDGTLFWCRVRGRSLLREHPFARAVWTFADMSTERPVLALSARERDVAILTCQGLTAKETARTLGLSHRTVEHYRAQLMTKAGARNTAEFVALFRPTADLQSFCGEGPDRLFYDNRMMICLAGSITHPRVPAPGISSTTNAYNGERRLIRSFVQATLRSSGRPRGESRILAAKSGRIAHAGRP